MVKPKTIDYNREVRLATLTDELAELVHTTVGKLSYHRAAHFLSGIEKATRKEAVKWKRIDGFKDHAYVRNGLREEIPHLHLKEGELVPITDIATKFQFSPSATLKALYKLREELEVALVHSWHDFYRPDYTYLMKLAPEKIYGKRIPIIGKPILPKINNLNPHYLDTQLLYKGSASSGEALELGVKPTPVGFSNHLCFGDFGANPKIIMECMRQIATHVRKSGWCWQINDWSDTDNYYRTSPVITKTESQNIWKGFIEKTELPVGTLEGKPVLVYHPKIIRQKI